MQHAVAARRQALVVGHQHEAPSRARAPGRASARTRRRRCWRSRLPVGSSASTQSGRPASARAIATRWRSPPESCDGRCCTRSPRPTCSSTALRRGARLGHRQAADAQRHRDVVERAELRQQVVELVDEAEVAVAPLALLGRAHRREVAPAQHHAALGRRLEAAEQVQQRALARARRADDRERLAGPHAEVDALQHLHVEPRRAAALDEALVQPGRGDHRRPAAGCRRPHVGSASAVSRRAAASLIAQRLGRLHAAGAPARVQRRDERQQQRDHDDRHDVAALRVARHAADQVDAAPAGS